MGNPSAQNIIKMTQFPASARVGQCFVFGVVFISDVDKVGIGKGYGSFGPSSAFRSISKQCTQDPWRILLLAGAITMTSYCAKRGGGVGLADVITEPCRRFHLTKRPCGAKGVCSVWKEEDEAGVGSDQVFALANEAQARAHTLQGVG